ncbi:MULTISPECIES: cysteine hydrolase family protein [unclassified Sulfitobacter]|uniref:cysteine hydrolase family protein n=1 Tax=unclassified Sulfitobacter TaxID=196795 RepID=UPI0011106D4B|nr:cysteine hydrolase [Sulfitobacter sp. BSw21498]|tara:strand:+ start:3275 stop:3949 length:675 start_codon:yes stop_codon:yes gene_type:complete
MGNSNSNIEIDKKSAALVVVDPQNDFLSESGVAWDLVGKSVQENGTVEHLGRLLETARENNFLIFISPHYYYPFDHEWKFGGVLEEKMHEIGMFDRKGPLSVENFEGSGADWVESYKPIIDHSDTVVVSPHKVYGPQSNDLVLQLRKRGIDTVLLAGMSANLCIESHMRELLEQGFKVIVISDATAAAQHPEMGDGYEAAMTNFRYIANEVTVTSEIIDKMKQA